MVSKLCKGKGHNFDFKVIDIGCGDCKVGKYLHDNGFEDIVGVDCNEDKLKDAKKKKVYSKLENLTLG